MWHEASEPVTEEALRAIRALGGSKGGQAMSDLLLGMRQEYINGMLRSKAEDAPSMAFGQAGAKICSEIWALLNGDIDVILKEHNIEPEEQ